MKNIEVKNQEQKTNIVNALSKGGAEEVAEAIMNVTIENSERIQNRLLEEAKNFNVANADQQTLAARGFRTLTNEERKYYNEVKDKSGLENVPMPRTIFDRVFEDLRTEHPLLSKITFQNTTGITEVVTRTNDVETAFWGPLCDEIKKKLENGFKIERVDLYKVSAYLPLCKAMLDLGPEWLDRFVRESLYESIAGALEKAILVGDGDNMPIGMTRQLDEVSGGKHQEKEATPLTDLKPATIGSEIMSKLTKGKVRTVGEVLLIVNPADYWSKLFPIFTFQTRDGEYRKQVLPFNGEVIQSVHVPVGKMVVGEARDYFVGIGSQMEIDYSDEYRFLDDQRVYIAKQYANGRPISDDAFLYLDISKMNNNPSADGTPSV